jgi:hypothetical protein
MGGEVAEVSMHITQEHTLIPETALKEDPRRISTISVGQISESVPKGFQSPTVSIQIRNPAAVALPALIETAKDHASMTLSRVDLQGAVGAILILPRKAMPM